MRTRTRSEDETGRSERYLREMEEKPTRNAKSGESKKSDLTPVLFSFFVFFFQVRSVCAPFLCHFYPKEGGDLNYKTLNS